MEKVLIDDSVLKISVVENEGEYCIVSFTGIGHGLNGIDLQTREFSALAPGFGTQIFVIDKTRSWGNALDMMSIAETLAPFLEDRKVVTLGNSMGGFIVILASGFFPTQTVIAFSPQYSVSKAVAPFERRWRKYTNKIKCFVYPDLTDSFFAETRCFLFFGMDRTDRRHFALFPSTPNVSKRFIGDDHNVARQLKSAGTLYPLITACMTSDAAEPKIDEIIGRSAA